MTTESDLRSEKIRIASWNVGGNTGYPWSDCARYLIDELHVDIALVQEAPVDEEDFVVATRCAKTHWGSAIISSLPAVGLDVPMPSEICSWLRIAAATVQTSVGQLKVASVHPHYGDAEYARKAVGTLDRFRVDGARYLWHCDLAYGVLSEALAGDTRFAIGGDWNTARGFQKSSVPDASFSEVFFERALLDSGWHDVLYEKDTQEVPTYTKHGSSYQLDHIFCDPLTAQSVREAYVPIDALERGLSDHAPVIVDLDLSRPA